MSPLPTLPWDTGSLSLCLFVSSISLPFSHSFPSAHPLSLKSYPEQPSTEAVIVSDFLDCYPESLSQLVISLTSERLPGNGQHSATEVPFGFSQKVTRVSFSFFISESDGKFSGQEMAPMV